MSAGNAIATGAVVLSANADGLLTGLDHTERAVGKWAHDVDSKLKTVGGGRDGKGAFRGGLVGGLMGTAAGAAVGASLGILSYVPDKFTEIAERIEAASHAADQLGASVQSLTALEHAAGQAGAKAEELQAAMRTLQKNAAAATSGDAGMAQSFARIGVAAGALKGLDLEGQLATIADGLSAVPNHADRAALAMQLLGDRGAKLLPLLGQGAGGVRELTAEARSLGLALSDADAEQVVKANDALDGMKDAVSGAMNRAVVAVAPAVEAFAHLTSKGIEFVTVGATAAGSMLGLGESSQSFGGLAVGAMEAVAKGAGYTWDAIKAGAGAVSYVTSYVVDGFALVVDTFEGTIHDLLDLAGKLPDELGGGWFREQAAAVDQWSGRVERAAADMRTWGQGTFDGFGQSAAAASAWFDRLRGELSKATRAKLALDRAGDGGGDHSPVKLAGALEQGSAAAYTAVTKYQVSAQMGGWNGGVADVAKQHLAEARAQTAFLKLVADAVKQVQVQAI